MNSIKVVGDFQVGDFCEKGHKVGSRNIVITKEGSEVWVVKCKACDRFKSKVPNGSRRLQLGDKCSHGHDLLGSNVEEYIRDGALSIRCVQCRKFTAAKSRSKVDIDRTEFDKEYELTREQKKNEKIYSVDYDARTGSYGGLKYLKLNKRSQKAWEPLEKAFDNTRSLCHKNPGPYIDYDENLPPSKEIAYLLCEGCPMLVECGRFANAYKPVIGVWGGQAWKDGKVVGK